MDQAVEQTDQQYPPGSSSTQSIIPNHFAPAGPPLPLGPVRSGYLYFCDNYLCGYSSCPYTTGHYHCQQCEYGTNELPQVIAHRDTCHTRTQPVPEPPSYLPPEGPAPPYYRAMFTPPWMPPPAPQPNWNEPLPPIDYVASGSSEPTMAHYYYRQDPFYHSRGRPEPSNSSTAPCLFSPTSADGSYCAPPPYYFTPPPLLHYPPEREKNVQAEGDMDQVPNLGSINVDEEDGTDTETELSIGLDSSVPNSPSSPIELESTKVLGLCLVCEQPIQPPSTQSENQSSYYVLTDSDPHLLTTLSRTIDIEAGQLTKMGDALCRRCGRLVETVALLETQLDSTRVELRGRYYYYGRNSLQKRKVEQQGEQQIAAEPLSDSADGKVEEDSSKSKPQCKECGKVFQSRKSLREHKQVHLRNKTVVCQICSKSFARKQHLSAHIRTHSGERPYKCVKCQRAFAALSNCTVHQVRCTGNLPYRCDEENCTKRFATKWQKEAHMKTIHRGEYDIRCSVCQKGFTKLSHLKEHERTHTGSKPFSCPDCGLGFGTRGNLNVHVNRRHKKQRENLRNCSECGKSFTRNEALQAHINGHKGIKPHGCPKCNKKFADKSNLRAHIRSHTVTTKAACRTIAKAKFKVCSICSKEICSNMNVHMRSHTGERPYKCSTCNKSFSTSASRKRHVGRSHVEHSSISQ